jgi:hypothetical protein
VLGEGDQAIGAAGGEAAAADAVDGFLGGRVVRPDSLAGEPVHVRWLFGDGSLLVRSEADPGSVIGSCRFAVGLLPSEATAHEEHTASDDSPELNGMKTAAI